MVKLFKKYIIDSQFYVSLVATMFTVFFMLEQDAFNPGIAVLVFFTYLNGYLYTKYQANKKMFPVVLAFNVVTFFCCILHIFYNEHFQFFPKWLLIVFLGLLYNSSFLEVYIRRLPFIKIFYVAFVWGLTNAWLFLEYFSLPIFLINSFFVSALILPFDIRDLRVDKIVTFPNVYGVRKTKYFAYILVILAVVIAVYSLKTDFAIAFILTGICTCGFIYFSKVERSDFYYSFGVETMDGIALLFLWLVSLF